MCWKYENKYYDCFDHVMENLDGEGNKIKEILQDYGIKFNNFDKCKEQFFKLLSKWHETGLIEPGG